MAVSGEVATFTVWDYLVIAAVLMVSTCIGIYYALAGGRQRTTKEFLLADRNMNPVPVALSLVASFISAITVLGTPAEVYRHNTMFWVICFAYISTGVITSRTFMTIFYEYEITSTNEVRNLFLIDQLINRSIDAVIPKSFINSFVYLLIFVHSFLCLFVHFTPPPLPTFQTQRPAFH